MPPTYFFDLVTNDSIHTDIYYPFKDAPKIGAIIDHEGQKWRRMPTLPCAQTDTKIDENSAADFIRKTGQMKGNYGELMDYSAEMSAKRAAKNNGLDPVKEKFYSDSKAKTGLEHPDVKKRNAKKALAEKGVILED
jgi:hypothetical protein